MLFPSGFPAGHSPQSRVMSVVVNIFPLGGLGNQLFVYAAGRARAASRHEPLVANLFSYAGDNRRDFQLDSFRSNLSVFRNDGSLRTSVKGRVAAAKFLAWGQVNRFRNTEVRVANAMKYREFASSRKDEEYLLGYYQSWKYFDKISSEIRTEVRDIVSPSLWYQDARQLIQSSRSSVALHVRRTDYKTNAVVGVLGEDYYHRALVLLENLGWSGELFLFSDEVDVVKSSNFLSRWRNRMQFITPPTESRPIESLNLMSQCDHIVTANSTFSWWGAWLGQRPGRQVIFPRPWGEGISIDVSDLVLPDWLGIGREVLA